MMYSVFSFVFFPPSLSKIRSIHCPCRWVPLLLCLEKLHNALVLTSRGLSGLESCTDGIDLPHFRKKKTTNQNSDSIAMFHVISTAISSITQYWFHLFKVFFFITKKTLWEMKIYRKPMIKRFISVITTQYCDIQQCRYYIFSMNDSPLRPSCVTLAPNQEPPLVLVVSGLLHLRPVPSFRAFTHFHWFFSFFGGWSCCLHGRHHRITLEEAAPPHLGHDIWTGSLTFAGLQCFWELIHQLLACCSFCW